MVRKAVDLNLFKGYKVGRGLVEISHLQFADDTLFIGDGSSQNILTMKGILRWFELISDFKDNFSRVN